MDRPARQRIHLRITGIVQGVCYRAYTRQQGQQLGLTGWVRNLPDGSVEVVAEGEQPALEALARWCRTGPPAAHVEQVQVLWSEASGELSTFDVRRG